MKIPDINPEKLMSKTAMYDTMVLSADGKSISMHNEVHAFKIKALPATTAFRLLKKYPIEIISWAYCGMPIKKSDVFAFGAMCLTDKQAVETPEEPEWESLDVIDHCWNTFTTENCILVADVQHKNDSSRYKDMNALVNSGAYDDRAHNLLELMTISTYIIRLSIDCFFLEYKNFLEKGKEMSVAQNNMFATGIQDTFLNVIQQATEHIKATGSTLMHLQREKLKKSKKS